MEQVLNPLYSFLDNCFHNSFNNYKIKIPKQLIISRLGFVDCGEDGNLTPVLEKKYAVRELKDPFASLGNYWDGSVIRLEDLSKMTGLKINYDDYFTKEVISIASFEMSLVYNGHTVITKPIDNHGAVFDESTKFLLSKAKSGDVIVFKNIRAISSLGSEIKLRSVLITVE